MKRAAKLVILRLLETALGHYEVQGPEYNFSCPFCEERAASHIGTLHVNLHKNAYLCHTCGAGGRNVAYIIRDVLGYMPYNKDAAKDIALISTNRKKFVKSIRRRLWPKKDQAAVVPLPEEFKRLILPAVTETGRIMYRYLRWRGLTDDDIDAYGLGYCAAGKWAGYIVFPFYQGGFPVYFTSRAVLAQSSRKSLNPEEDRRWYLYNYDRAIKERHIVIVEGPIDAIRVGRYAMGIGGKVLREEQIDLLDLDHVDEITVVMDADAHADTLANAARLKNRLNKKITYVLLKDGDPADNADFFADLLEDRVEMTFGEVISMKLMEDSMNHHKVEYDDDDPADFQRRIRTKLTMKVEIND